MVNVLTTIKRPVTRNGGCGKLTRRNMDLPFVKTRKLPRMHLWSMDFAQIGLLRAHFKREQLNILFSSFLNRRVALEGAEFFDEFHGCRSRMAALSGGSKLKESRSVFFKKY